MIPSASVSLVTIIALFLQSSSAALPVVWDRDRDMEGELTEEPEIYEPDLGLARESASASTNALKCFHYVLFRDANRP